MALDDGTLALQAGLLAGAFVLFGASLAVRELTRAVAAFAGGSAFIAAAYFMLDAPYAGLLALLVGGALTAVMFLAALTLTRGTGSAKEAGG